MLPCCTRSMRVLASPAVAAATPLHACSPASARPLPLPLPLPQARPARAAAALAEARRPPARQMHTTRERATNATDETDHTWMPPPVPAAVAAEAEAGADAVPAAPAPAPAHAHSHLYGAAPLGYTSAARPFRSAIAELAMRHPEVHMLLHRCEQLQAEGEMLHTRRGRRSDKGIGRRRMELADAHAPAAREHARQVHLVVARLMQLERESLRGQGQGEGRQAAHTEEEADMPAALAEGAHMAEDGGVAPAAANALPKGKRSPMALGSAYFPLVSMLRGLPSELVDPSLLHRLWAQIALARVPPADWRTRWPDHRFPSFTAQTRLCNMMLDLASSCEQTDLLWRIWCWISEHQRRVQTTIITTNAVLTGLMRHMLAHMDARQETYGPQLEAAGFTDLRRAPILLAIQHLAPERERFVQAWQRWERVFQGMAGEGQPHSAESPSVPLPSGLGDAAHPRSPSHAAPIQLDDPPTPLFADLRAIIRPHVLDPATLPSLSPASCMPPPVLFCSPCSGAIRDPLLQQEVLKYLLLSALPFHAAHWVTEVMRASGSDIGNRLVGAYDGGVPFANLLAFKSVVGAVERAMDCSDARYDMQDRYAASSTPMPPLTSLCLYSEAALLPLLTAFWRVMTESLLVLPDVWLMAQYMRLLKRMRADEEIVHACQQHAQQREAMGLRDGQQQAQAPSAGPARPASASRSASRNDQAQHQQQLVDRMLTDAVRRLSLRDAKARQAQNVHARSSARQARGNNPQAGSKTS